MKRILVGVQHVALLAAVFCASCSERALIFDRDSPDAYWRSGDYVLIAIDTEAQMSLKIDDGKHSGVFDEVVSATVYAVGANDRYIVAKQHPLLEDQTHFDRRVTNYFIVDRMISSTLRPPQQGVTGPLAKEGFEQMAAKMALPRFTKTFRTLEWQRTE